MTNSVKIWYLFYQTADPIYINARIITNINAYGQTMCPLSKLLNVSLQGDKRIHNRQKVVDLEQQKTQNNTDHSIIDHTKL